MNQIESVDLFDTLEVWAENPRDAFHAFVTSLAFVQAGKRFKPNVDQKKLQPIRNSSATVYIAMFERFLAWLEDQNLNFTQVSNGEIKQFLNVREADGTLRLTSKIRGVYVRLLERIYGHLQVFPNPASQVVLDYKEPFRKGREDAKAFLMPDQIEAVMNNLPPAPIWNPTSNIKRQHGWDKRRNRALVAALMGAGLKVSEVAMLRLQAVQKMDSEGNIPVELNLWDGSGSGRPHRPVIQSFAAKEVQKWLDERARMDFHCDLVFPSAIDSTAPLSHPTIYRYVNKTLEDAGIDAVHTGGRTLRNTYAAKQLADSKDIELVAERMGHRDTRATEMYKGAARDFAGEVE